MSESIHFARVRWDADRDDPRAHTVELADQTLAASSAVVEDSQRTNPEEMLVASLSSCHMLWFLALARAERLRVASYEDNPEGTMDEARFIHVAMRPRITFDGEVDAAMVESLHHRAHQRCFIANSVNFPVEVEHPS